MKNFGHLNSNYCLELIVTNLQLSDWSVLSFCLQLIMSDDNNKPNGPFKGHPHAHSLDLVQCCESVRDLHLLTMTGFWRGVPEIRDAIIERYHQLDPEGQFQFANDEFWNATGGEDEYEEANEWLWGEDEHMDQDLTEEEENRRQDSDSEEEQVEEEEDPWMLEKDFNQAGGREEDLAPPEVTPPEDLYTLTPVSNQQYQRYHANRTRYELNFKNDKRVEDFDDQAPQMWQSVLDRVVDNPGEKDKVRLGSSLSTLTWTSLFGFSFAPLNL